MVYLLPRRSDRRSTGSGRRYDETLASRRRRWLDGAVVAVRSAFCESIVGVDD